MTHKILIADDEPNIVISLEYLMKREGYDVSVARDGPAALAAIRRERPALVLLDVMMPGMSGFEVCQAVRADESLAGVKIVMLTAKGRDTDVAKGTALGADAYVTKPVSTRELAERVRELLGMKIDRRELIATLAPGLLLALMAAGVGLLLAATLEPAERAAFTAMLESRGALLLLAWLVLSGAIGALLRGRLPALGRLGRSPGRTGRRVGRGRRAARDRTRGQRRDAGTGRPVQPAGAPAQRAARRCRRRRCGRPAWASNRSVRPPEMRLHTSSSKAGSV